VKTRELEGFFSPKFYQQMLKKGSRQKAVGNGETAEGKEQKPEMKGSRQWAICN
jgi:hypothetical protein